MKLIVKNSQTCHAGAYQINWVFVTWLGTGVGYKPYTICRDLQFVTYITATKVYVILWDVARSFASNLTFSQFLSVFERFFVFVAISLNVGFKHFENLPRHRRYLVSISASASVTVPIASASWWAGEIFVFSRRDFLPGEIFCPMPARAERFLPGMNIKYLAVIKVSRKLIVPYTRYQPPSAPFGPGAPVQCWTSRVAAWRRRVLGSGPLKF